MVIFLQATLLLAATVTLSHGALYCKDEDGKDVDWFVAYKIPRQADEPEPLSTGYSYAFMAGKPIAGRGSEQTSGWKLGSTLITDPESMFGKTLAAGYADPSKYTSIMYNDYPPEAKGDGFRAHAKGVLAMDKDTGFWLVHSVPNYAPAFTSKYEYPDSGRLNGQTLLCVSFKTATQANKIAEQLTFMQPHLYGVHITEEVEALAPALRVVEAGKLTKVAEGIAEITSVKGTVFKSFAKSRKAGNDLYSELVAPELDTDLFVETWRRGAGSPLVSNCTSSTRQKINNIDNVNLKLIKSPLTTTNVWKYLSDHAKWAVSQDVKKPFACIGDINRMASQYKRGGGTVCFQSPAVWSVLQESISSIEPCTK